MGRTTKIYVTSRKLHYIDGGEAIFLKTPTLMSSPLHSLVGLCVHESLCPFVCVRVCVCVCVCVRVCVCVCVLTSLVGTRGDKIRAFKSIQSIQTTLCTEVHFLYYNV